MKIKEILSEYRNDFSYMAECEHCKFVYKVVSGYHDNYYHTKVIPGMFCPKCGKNRLGEVQK